MLSPKYVEWGLRLIAAAILLQNMTLVLAGHPAMIDMFDSLSLEPGGRWVVGALVLAATIFLLVPHTLRKGIGLGLICLAGLAIVQLITSGLEWHHDSGKRLFLMFFAAACLLALTYRHK